jgi:hypothetical protein
MQRLEEVAERIKEHWLMAKVADRAKRGGDVQESGTGLSEVRVSNSEPHNTFLCNLPPSYHQEHPSEALQNLIANFEEAGLKIKRLKWLPHISSCSPGFSYFLLTGPIAYLS